MSTFIKCFLLVLLLSPSLVSAQGKNFAMMGNLGTDVSLGLGYGIGLRYFAESGGGHYIEFGPDYYYHTSEETYEENHTYNETTELTVFAVRANHLSPIGRNGNLLIVGAGAAAINVYWIEESATDTSLGTPCCGGGSRQDWEGTAFGALFNIGVHIPMSRTNFLRIETPIIMINTDTQLGTVFIPTMTMSFGFLL